MSNALLGRLERVDLRVAWDDAADFTPWLTQDENLRQLSEVLDLHLERAPEERGCAARGGILCREHGAPEEHWVLFEPQLEPSSDACLGRLFSHAAGLDRVTAVWIAAEFSDEHRRAVEWLNRSTTERCRFYAVQLELWRINYSPAAPVFNAVCRPPDAALPAELTPDERLQLEYWSAFGEELARRGAALTLPTPRARNWAGFPLEKPGFELWTFVNLEERRIGMVLETFGGHAKAHFHLLREQRAAIEEEVGEPIEWDERPGQKGAALMLRRPETDPTHRVAWAAQHRWLTERLERFHAALAPRIAALDAADYFRVDEEPDLTIPVELLNLDFS